MSNISVLTFQGTVCHFPSLISLTFTFSSSFINYLEGSLHSFNGLFDSSYVHSPLYHSFKLQEPLGLWFYHIFYSCSKTVKMNMNTRTRKKKKKKKFKRVFPILVLNLA